MGRLISDVLEDDKLGHFSFEFFPSKTAIGAQNLCDRLKRMQKLNPSFVTVTWGAGGSTAQKSLDLALYVQNTLNLTTCLHLTCTNMEREVLDHALEEAKAGGIRNILALRGDPPRGEEYFDRSESEFTYAIDLVRYIRQKYGDYFCIGVAAYPEGHGEGSVPKVQDPAQDLPYLVEKVRAGADFIITQLFYDADAFIAFEETLRQHPSGVFKNLHILPGLMPINSFASVRRIARLSHATMPASYLSQLEVVKSDDGKVKAAGVDMLSEMITDIQVRTQQKVKHFHFYTLNLEKSVALILEQSQLLYQGSASDSAGTAVDGMLTPSNGTSAHLHPPQRRASSAISDPHNRVIVDNIREGIANMDMITDAKGAGKPASEVEQDWNSSIAISEGEGSLGRAATWDDFPNGRFGDSRSPAFGNIDGYGVSLHVGATEAIKLWGNPETASDVSDLFVRHINGELRMIPWSEEGLNPESQAIKNRLIRLNRNEFWTIASQPAVNGAKSTHSVFGWGPSGGFVFQKAFVEFFVSPSRWQRLKALLSTKTDFTYYAGNLSGDFETNAEEGDANAVTWGVFPGKEIVQPTIIEEVSFKAWLEEAFAIWKEWKLLYPRGSRSKSLLEDIVQNYYLVNIVHHGFVNGDALWDLLDECGN